MAAAPWLARWLAWARTRARTRARAFVVASYVATHCQQAWLMQCFQGWREGVRTGALRTPERGRTRSGSASSASTASTLSLLRDLDTEFTAVVASIGSRIQRIHRLGGLGDDPDAVTLTDLSVGSRGGGSWGGGKAAASTGFDFGSLSAAGVGVGVAGAGAGDGAGDGPYAGAGGGGYGVDRSWAGRDSAAVPPNEGVGARASWTPALSLASFTTPTRGHRDHGAGEPSMLFSVPVSPVPVVLAAAAATVAGVGAGTRAGAGPYQHAGGPRTHAFASPGAATLMSFAEMSQCADDAVVAVQLAAEAIARRCHGGGRGHVARGDEPPASYSFPATPVVAASTRDGTAGSDASAKPANRSIATSPHSATPPRGSVLPQPQPQPQPQLQPQPPTSQVPDSLPPASRSQSLPPTSVGLREPPPARSAQLAPPEAVHGGLDGSTVGDLYDGEYGGVDITLGALAASTHAQPLVRGDDGVWEQQQRQQQQRQQQQRQQWQQQQQLRQQQQWQQQQWQQQQWQQQRSPPGGVRVGEVEAADFESGSGGLWARQAHGKHSGRGGGASTPRGPRAADVARSDSDRGWREGGHSRSPTNTTAPTWQSPEVKPVVELSYAMLAALERRQTQGQGQGQDQDQGKGHGNGHAYVHGHGRRPPGPGGGARSPAAWSHVTVSGAGRPRTGPVLARHDIDVDVGSGAASAPGVVVATTVASAPPARERTPRGSTGQGGDAGSWCSSLSLSPSACDSEDDDGGDGGEVAATVAERGDQRLARSRSRSRSRSSMASVCSTQDDAAPVVGSVSRPQPPRRFRAVRHAPTHPHPRGRGTHEWGQEGAGEGASAASTHASPPSSRSGGGGGGGGGGGASRTPSSVSSRWTSSLRDATSVSASTGSTVAGGGRDPAPAGRSYADLARDAVRSHHPSLRRATRSSSPTPRRVPLPQPPPRPRAPGGRAAADDGQSLLLLHARAVMQGLGPSLPSASRGAAARGASAGPGPRAQGRPRGRDSAPGRPSVHVHAAGKAPAHGQHLSVHAGVAAAGYLPAEPAVVLAGVATCLPEPRGSGSGSGSGSGGGAAAVPVTAQGTRSLGALAAPAAPAPAATRVEATGAASAIDAPSPPLPAAEVWAVDVHEARAPAGAGAAQSLSADTAAAAAAAAAGLGPASASPPPFPDGFGFAEELSAAMQALAEEPPGVPVPLFLPFRGRRRRQGLQATFSPVQV